MTTRSQSGDPRNAAQDVANLGLIRPPLVYLISLVLGALVQRAAPLPILPRPLAVPLGVSLVVVAVALFSSSAARFRAAGTPVPARKPTTVIVRTGPYRFSPNPDLSGVLALTARYRDLGQQPVAADHTRWGGGTHPLRRHTAGGAVPSATIRCRVLGLQGLRAPLAVSTPTSGWERANAGRTSCYAAHRAALAAQPCINRRARDGGPARIVPSGCARSLGGHQTSGVHHG